MVGKETYLDVADNSGALKLLVIHIEGSTGKKEARLGEIVICSVKKAIPGGTVKKKQIVKAVVVRTRKALKRADGSYIRFGGESANAAVIVTTDNKEGEALPVGTRIFGPIARELKVKKYSKIVSLAPEIV